MRAEILFVQWRNPPWCKVTFCWMECSLQHSKRNAILQTLFGEFVLPFAHSNRRFQWSSQLSNEHYLPKNNHYPNKKWVLPNHKIGLSNQQIGSFWRAKVDIFRTTPICHFSIVSRAIPAHFLFLIKKLTISQKTPPFFCKILPHIIDLY